MIRITLEMRAFIIMAMASVLVVFSTLSVFTFLAVGVGTAVTVLGMIYGYRPGTMIGLMILAGISAAALQLDTVLAVDMLMTAILGRLVPLLVIMILGLSSYETDEELTRATVRPFATTILFGVSCIAAVPIAGFAIGVLAPVLSTNLNAMNEIGIIVLAAIAGAILLTREKVETGPGRLPEPEETGK